MLNIFRTFQVIPKNIKEGHMGGDSPIGGKSREKGNHLKSLQAPRDCGGTIVRKSSWHFNYNLYDFIAKKVSGNFS